MISNKVFYSIYSITMNTFGIDKYFQCDRLFYFIKKKVNKNNIVIFFIQPNKHTVHLVLVILGHISFFQASSLSYKFQ